MALWESRETDNLFGQNSGWKKGVEISAKENASCVHGTSMNKVALEKYLMVYKQRQAEISMANTSTKESVKGYPTTEVN